MPADQTRRTTGRTWPPRVAGAALCLVSLAGEAALFALAATLLLRGTWSGRSVLDRLAEREAGRGRERRAVRPGSAWSARSSSEPVAPFE
jgi:hypothetical protein